jgi:ABC-2 type transport system ATP-binding protein
MVSNEPVISLRDVGIQFARNRRRHRSIRELLIHGRTGTRPDEFWPFRHINLDIDEGEQIGVVGRNGMGKSTLLRLIAGVLLPDEGSVTVRAGVAPLIAITGGFEGELSARENIYLVSGLHGMTRRQIEESFDEIVDFAELGDFLDTPYKHFSSGMKVRLAFSVVSRLQEPILLVDEVLAVGDKAFRRKCFKRIDDLIATGRRCSSSRTPRATYAGSASAASTWRAARCAPTDPSRTSSTSTTSTWAPSTTRDNILDNEL